MKSVTKCLRMLGLLYRQFPKEEIEWRRLDLVLGPLHDVLKDGEWHLVRYQWKGAYDERLDQYDMFMRLDHLDFEEVLEKTREELEELNEL